MAPVDLDKLRHHVDHVRGNLRRLRDIAGQGREAFLSDEITSTASVRYLQTAIEAVIDIGNHIISREGLGIPSTYAETIELLVDAGILPRERRESFLQMVRFRNRAVHLYDEIDDAEVFEILDRHLGDFDLVVAAMTTRYFGYDRHAKPQSES